MKHYPSLSIKSSSSVGKYIFLTALSLSLASCLSDNSKDTIVDDTFITPSMEIKNISVPSTTPSPITTSVSESSDFLEDTSYNSDKALNLLLESMYVDGIPKNVSETIGSLGGNTYTFSDKISQENYVFYKNFGKKSSRYADISLSKEHVSENGDRGVAIDNTISLGDNIIVMVQLSQ